MRSLVSLSALIVVGFVSATAMANPSNQEPTMKSKPATAATPSACDAPDTSPDKGNGGYSKGRNARAVGGSGNVGRDTGNGGVAIGDNADASGGDANQALRKLCDGTARLGNGGVARGDGAKATGGSGNVVRF